ncbi:MAG: SIMPL domain-containing protein [Leptolinea sp.]|nr:SIMPL domain-containing protein [Leptolinea sp.]
MKKTSRYPIILTIAGLVLLIINLLITPHKVQAAKLTTEGQTKPQTCNSSRTIQVTGSALINVAPDRALVTLGVQTNGKTVSAVQRANDSAIQKVIAAVKQQGVDAADITTDLFVIEPIYEDYDSLYIKGYRTYNTISVTIRDVSKTSRIVAAALSAGANQIDDVNFYTTDLRKYRDQAREMAVVAAREKADALASASGAEVTCVLNINENSWSYFNGWRFGSSSRQANLWTQNAIQNVSPSGEAEEGNIGEKPISPGQIAVKAEVSITFALE